MSNFSTLALLKVLMSSVILLHASMQVAEQTPLTAARYGELALEAGIPPGVLNVIQGGASRCLVTSAADGCWEHCSNTIYTQAQRTAEFYCQQTAVLTCRLWAYGGRGARQPPRRGQGGLL